MPSLPAERAALLDRPLIAHVAVAAPDATPRSFPMWFVRAGDEFRFTATSERPQGRWLRPGDAFALSVLDPDNPYRYAGVGLRLTARDPDPTGAFFDELAARYGLEVRLADPSTRLILRATPERFWHQ